MGPDYQVTHTVVLVGVPAQCFGIVDNVLRVVFLYLGTVKDSHDNLELIQLTNRMTVRHYIWFREHTTA